MEAIGAVFEVVAVMTAVRVAAVEIAAAASVVDPPADFAVDLPVEGLLAVAIVAAFVAAVARGADRLAAGSIPAVFSAAWTATETERLTRMNSRARPSS